MKNLKLFIAGLLLVFSGVIYAQVGITVTVGTPPAWAPAEAVGVRYYYIPDIEAYYDVNAGTYIYMSNGAWVRTAYLPPAYARYDIWGGYKVVLRDYDGDKPYEHFERHRKDYPRGYNHGHAQKTYGERQKEERHEEHKEHHDEGRGEHRGH
ncbi:MAG TPA: hypothetical protein VNY36_01400 [Bacteroidia bacterium]|jgi:hypothetical protein|nr:hypothetical protein [Bacteroidia bacterium]